MSTTTCTELAVAPVTWAEPEVPFTYRKTRAMHLYERGMATAEYAIGILAAVAVALTLAKFLTGSDYATKWTKAISAIIGNLGTQIKVAK